MDRWKEIERLYFQARALAPEEREGFLKKACQGDEALFREVSSLLNALPEVKDFLERPVKPANDIAGAPLQKEGAPLFSHGSEAALRMSANSTITSLIGQQLNSYQILSLLGKGGMGEVYLAQDTRLDRQVALKVLPPEVIADPERLKRFVREAKAASALDHPNIATIHELGEAKGVHYIVMEYVEGETLADRIHGRVPSPCDPAPNLLLHISRTKLVERWTLDLLRLVWHKKSSR